MDFLLLSSLFLPTHDVQRTLRQTLDEQMKQIFICFDCVFRFDIWFFFVCPFSTTTTITTTTWNPFSWSIKLPIWIHALIEHVYIYTFISSRNVYNSLYLSIYTRACAPAPASIYIYMLENVCRWEHNDKLWLRIFVLIPFLFFFRFILWLLFVVALIFTLSLFCRCVPFWFSSLVSVTKNRAYYLSLAGTIMNRIDRHQLITYSLLTRQ